MLPTSLPAALDALEAEPMFRRAFGDLFVGYYLALKRAEFRRFVAFLEQHRIDASAEEITDWEQDEYFDFF
jgi:glutamine synthetase